MRPYKTISVYKVNKKTIGTRQHTLNLSLQPGYLVSSQGFYAISIVRMLLEGVARHPFSHPRFIKKFLQFMEET